MLGKKRRVKTGCLTCRQRRVKCDERKPTCERCQVANVYCEGYDSQRRLESKLRVSAVDSNQSQSPPSSAGSRQPLISFRADGLPIVGCPTNPTCAEQPPHPRARDVLAHHQYTFRTAPMLFREEHLFFWRERVLDAAWAYEYVYDVVVALGTVHRSALFLALPYEKWKGLDTKVIALQMYGNALKQLSGEFSIGKRCMDLQVGVLLLLVYFECFIGNAVAAFRHLRAAKFYFTAAGTSLRNEHAAAVEPLATSILQLELVTQLFLPLPCISLLGEASGGAAETMQPNGHDNTELGLDLHKIIASCQEVTSAILTPLSGNITRLDSVQVNSFQTELRRWRDVSDSLFEECDEEPIMPSIPSSSWASLDELPIPPRPQYFSSVETAITVSLYNCFMAHTMWLLSITTNASYPCEISAYLYAYQNMRIVEGLLSSNLKPKMGEERYFSAESLNIGLAPILYLTAQCCYSPAWQQWIVDKLRYIGQEGLFNSEALATCLDLLKSYQHTERADILNDGDSAWRSQSPLGRPASRIIPTLVPDPDGRQFTGYYVQLSRGHHKPSAFSKSLLEVRGRATWTVEDRDSAEQKRSIDIHTHKLSMGDISDLRTEIGVHANRWEALYRTPACQMSRGMDDYINECSFPVIPKKAPHS